MIHSTHKRFSVTGIPATDDAWRAQSLGFMYLNVFDVRDQYNDWDMDAVFFILEAFKEMCGDFGYDYNKDPEYNQICVYTRDLDWQMLAKLHGYDTKLFARLEQVVHRVIPQVSRFVPKDWKPAPNSPEFDRLFKQYSQDENA